jgi:hypothetical protein
MGLRGPWLGKLMSEVREEVLRTFVDHGLTRQITKSHDIDLSITPG